MQVGGPAHTAWLSEAVMTTEHGVRILGGVPKSPNIEIPERHLGLHMPQDDTLPQNYISRLADLVESHVDLDAILAAAAMCEPAVYAESQLFRSTVLSPLAPKQVRIGVARDAAFCFYYHENLAQLQGGSPYPEQCLSVSFLHGDVRPFVPLDCDSVFGACILTGCTHFVVPRRWSRVNLFLAYRRRPATQPGWHLFWRWLP